MKREEYFEKLIEKSIEEYKPIMNKIVKYKISGQKDDEIVSVIKLPKISDSFFYGQKSDESCIEIQPTQILFINNTLIKKAGEKQ